MVRRLNYGRNNLDESVDDVIESFLNHMEFPQTFGDIQNHLKKRKIQYKNSENDRSGLSHTLNRMIKKIGLKKFQEIHQAKNRDTSHLKNPLLMQVLMDLS